MFAQHIRVEHRSNGHATSSRMTRISALRIALKIFPIPPGIARRILKLSLHTRTVTLPVLMALQHGFCLAPGNIQC